MKATASTSAVHFPSKQAASQATRMDHQALRATHEALKTPGHRLDTPARSFFEPRFHHDFSKISIHSGDAAAVASRRLGAEAFTIGRHIVFGENQYRPQSNSGRKLLAHELTHVIQNRNAPETHPSAWTLDSGAFGAEREADTLADYVTGARPPSAPPFIGSAPFPGVIRRKIATHNVPIDDYLTGKGIRDYQNSGSVYAHNDICTIDPDKEILYGLLSSRIDYPVAGSTSEAARTHLDKHVKARKGIVDYTYKKLTWGVGPTMKMNSDYWQTRGENTGPKPGVSFVEASRDVFENPTGFDYAMACEAAAYVTFAAGSSSGGYREATVHPDEWTPGDFGYIKNSAYQKGVSKPGTEGENIIHVRGSMFWGHPFGENSLNEWLCKIRSWNGNTGRPAISGLKKVTSVGLDP